MCNKVIAEDVILCCSIIKYKYKWHFYFEEYPYCIVLLSRRQEWRWCYKNCQWLWKGYFKKRVYRNNETEVSQWQRYWIQLQVTYRFMSTVCVQCACYIGSSQYVYVAQWRADIINVSEVGTGPRHSCSYYLMPCNGFKNLLNNYCVW